jgi:hypothetical protein
MRDSVANTSALDPWSELLRQARSALSLLRVEDLEDLAARAECMLEATVGDDAVRQRMGRPQKQAMTGLAQEQRLLRSLLIETDRNLKVLQRSRDDWRVAACSGEVNSRWVR